VDSCFHIKYTSESKDGLLRFKIYFQEIKNPKDPTRALLDTGANCNLISSIFVENNFVQKIPISASRRVKFANKTKSELCSVITLSFDIEHCGIFKSFSAEFLICKDICETVIMGRPFLDQSGLMHLCVTSETASNPFLFTAYRIEIEHLDDKDGEDDIDTIEPILSERAFDDSTTNLWILFADQFQLSPKEFFNTIAWAAINTKIKISEILDKMNEIKQLQGDPNIVPFERSDIIIERKPHKDAPYPEVNKAVHGIMNYFNCIWDRKRLGLANFRGMNIKFYWDQFRAKRMNPQNLNEPMTAALATEMQRFESAGLIEDVPREDMEKGLVAISPMDLIPKPTQGKFRCVTDFKRSGVNEASEVLNYASPNADEHLDFVCGHDLISVADAMSFFWQLPLHKDSRNICAFINKLHLKRYVAVPQGHRNSANHAVQVVDESLILEDMKGIWRVYFDDWGNGSNFRSNNDEKYWDFLIAICMFHCWALRYNVRFDPDHAYFGFTKLDFLGFSCSKDGKSLSESRTSALRNLTCSKSKESVLHFLGCFVFVSRWIPRFAELAAPLYSLLKKGTRAEQAWGPEQDFAINALKSCIDRAPILRVVNFEQELFFRSDGSIIAVAAVIFQMIDMKEIPAAYGSKILSKSQRKWPVPQIEFYAIICFIRRWKGIMQGHPRIIIQMDAQNLLWSRTSSNDMIKRWVFELDTLLTVADMQHIPGATNQPSDALSRCFNCSIDNDDCGKEYSIGVLENLNYYSLVKDQILEEDSSCLNFMIEDLESSNTDPVPGFERFAQDVEMVMTKERHSVISLCHNDEVGHCGVSGTISLLRRTNLHKHSCFSNCTHMASLVSMFIKACPTCQLTYMTLRSRYPLHDMVTIEYFRIVDIDFVYIGMEKNGYSHILGLRDRLTRWVEGFPCKTTTAEEFAPHLLAVSQRYGPFESICMDNADYFVQRNIDLLLSLMGSNRKRISPYRPQSNPMERSNKDIMRHFRALCLCRPEVADEWSIYLPIVLSIINNTFNAITHTTPAKMMYGDGVNRLRGILLPFGESSLREELGSGLAARISEGHAFIMAAAEDYQQERIRIAMDAMPSFSQDMIYQIGDYVVAILPYNVHKKSKLQVKYRGIYLVVGTSGENNSTVQCKCPVTDIVCDIHAEQLRPIDLKALASSEEVTALAAKLLNEPEFVVTSIDNHRLIATRKKPALFPSSDSMLNTMEFHCRYLGMPEDQNTWWNHYKDIKHLPLLVQYIDTARNRVPAVLANGKDLESATVPQLMTFAREYNISIATGSKKNIIETIRNANK
jgi:hypothetical protein